MYLKPKKNAESFRTHKKTSNFKIKICLQDIRFRQGFLKVMSKLVWSFTAWYFYLIATYVENFYLLKIYLNLYEVSFAKNTLYNVQIFWEGHKNLAHLPLIFDVTKWYPIKSGRWAQCLWPSQNIWTLLNSNILGCHKIDKKHNT